MKYKGNVILNKDTTMSGYKTTACKYNMAKVS